MNFQNFKFKRNFEQIEGRTGFAYFLKPSWKYKLEPLKTCTTRSRQLKFNRY